MKKILELMEKCYEVEGTFSLLWHNTSVSDDWEDWVKEVYIPAIIAAKDKKEGSGNEYCIHKEEIEWKELKL